MYSNHKQIPSKYRRIILDETLSKRVSKVPLSVCNEIIERAIEEEQENETLKNYQVEFIKNGKHGVVEVSGRQQALVECDKILDFGECKDPSVVIAVRQAKRLINGYVKCQWMFPEPRDKIRYVSRSYA